MDARDRADNALVRLGIVSTRSQARSAILSGKVFLNGSILEKPSRLVSPTDQLLLKSEKSFVGRGGKKLEGFLENFPQVSMGGKRVLDVGASTGGFTDCALQRGAQSVTCVDVGHGQLHPSLRANPKVTNLEGINIRYPAPGILPFIAYEIVVVDVSFISLRKIVPNLWPLLEKDGYLILLVKPQFEADKAIIKRCKGVIKDSVIQTGICSEIIAHFLSTLEGCLLIGQIPSPLLGGDGNREFLVGFQRQ